MSYGSNYLGGFSNGGGANAKADLGINPYLVERAVKGIKDSAQSFTKTFTKEVQQRIDTLCEGWVSKTGVDRINDIVGNLNTFNQSFCHDVDELVDAIEQTAIDVSNEIGSETTYKASGVTVSVETLNNDASKSNVDGTSYVIVEYLQTAKKYFNETYKTTLGDTVEQISMSASNSGLYDKDESLQSEIKRITDEISTKCEEVVAEIVSYIDYSVEHQGEAAIAAKQRGAEKLAEWRTAVDTSYIQGRM